MSLIPGGIYQFGSYTLDGGRLTLNKGGEAVLLPPKLFELLAALVSRRGAIATKDELLETVWPDAFVEEGNLTQSIFILRRRLGKTEAGDEYIQTVPRRGYRLNVLVTEAGTTPGLPVPKDSSNPPAADRTLFNADTRSPAKTLTRTLAGASPFLWIVPILVALASIVVTAILLRLPSERPMNMRYVQLTRDGMDKRGEAYTHGGPPAALATDGARIYFTEGSSGGTRLAEVSVSGGETVTLPVPFTMTQLLDYSSARSELLVGGFSTQSTGERLWAVSVPGGASHPIGEIEASDAAWSPGGSAIAFTRGTVLYRSSPDGSDVRQIARLPSNPYRPRWSPDARTIRFTLLERRTKGQSLWEVGVDGSNLRPILPGWNSSSPQCCGEWSKDSKSFVFQAAHEGTTQIWSMLRTNGLTRSLGLESPQQITNAPQDLLTPTLSPDGATLYVLAQQLRGELVQYDGHELLPYLGGKSFDYLEFSRDGAWITYVAYPEGTLWRSRPDGTDRLQLTFSPMRVMLPHWSPDNREIVFHGLGTDSNRDYTISAMGGVPRPVFDEEVMTLDWSPDGASFVYSDFPFFATKPEDTAVHLYNIRDKQVTTLPESKGLVSPVWSPDGRYIAASKAYGDRQTVVFNTGTKSWSKLVRSRGIPRWSHDSKWLFYMPAGDEQAIMKIRISDGQTENVVDLTHMRITGGLAGVQFSLSPQDLPVLLRDTGTQEIYSVALTSR